MARSLREMLCKQTFAICAGLVITVMVTEPCRAIDYQPFDFEGLLRCFR